MELYDNFLRVVKELYIIIYARLSKEESGKSSEEQSKSIKNQIEVCKKYIEGEKKNYPNCKFSIVAILKDDGISGTTFNREDFNKLIKLIEEKKANMVITKDLSRLGRDHIKSDNFLEKWFPERNVRYVSILENVDTYTDCISNEVAPLINWANDNFARQTSKKIKGIFEMMRNNGYWTGGEVPLGYKIDPLDHHHFIVDEKGKRIVKRIFDLALSNKSISEIVDILTLEKVPIPTVIKGNKRNINPQLKNLWTRETVRAILKNEMYLGHMIQGKSTSLNNKSDTIIYLNKDRWVKVLNTHEAIIDKKTFDSVQLLIKCNRNKTNKTRDYLLKGLLKCKECNHSISIQHYNNRKKYYTTCNYYRKYGNKRNLCTAHRFIYQTIEKLVLDNIINECLNYVDEKVFIDILKNKSYGLDKDGDIFNKIEKSNREINKLRRQIDMIYEDRLNEVIDEEQYIKMVKLKKDLLEYELNNKKIYENKLKSIDNREELDYSSVIKEFLSLKKNPRILIVKLIDKIYISQNGTIDIYYKIRKVNDK